MKNLIALFAIMVFSCKSGPVKVQPAVLDSESSVPGPVKAKDSDMLKPASWPAIQSDSTIAMLEAENDSLKTALFISQYKVNRVRYYLNISLKNSSQDKFLKGWIKRAIQ